MDQLTVSAYQQGTKATAIYSEGIFLASQEHQLEGWALISYCAHGLAGEAGEFGNDVKKIVRDDGGIVTSERREKLFKELGDIAWYMSQACTELGFKLEDVFDYNLSKLASRQNRGVLAGSGDDR